MAKRKWGAKKQTSEEEISEVLDQVSEEVSKIDENQMGELTSGLDEKSDAAALAKPEESPKKGQVSKQHPKFAKFNKGEK